ncbi:MAG: electron transfer flavoprotein subunit alpha/FixB family protein [Thermoplasmata archaeon]|nr:electron transfer flavoprotein subunit alpha/FixB family protein [Thermoplasmata archaeon]
MTGEVFIYAEQREGVLKKVALELLGAGRRLANDLGVPLGAILIGHGVKGMAQDLFAYGADKVYLVDAPELEHFLTLPYTTATVKAIKDFSPEIVVFPATHIGRDLAPRVAQRIYTGLTADCTGLDIDPESKLLVSTRPTFGGSLMAQIMCPTKRPQMSTCRPGVMRPLEPDRSRKGRIVKVDFKPAPGDMAVKLLEMVKEAHRKVDLEAAKIIVSGGRGVGGAAGFEKIRALAEALGGEVGGSRVAVDSGWIDHDHQVGQTGKTVAPELYIACGISGSVQHRAGMMGSTVIVAINKDPQATIHSVADYSIVGDLHEVVPALTAAIKAMQD